MGQKAVAMSVGQRPGPRKRGAPGKIELGGVLHGQHHRPRRQPTPQGVVMAGDNRVGINGLVIKKAIGRRLSRRAPQGFGQRGGRGLG